MLDKIISAAKSVKDIILGASDINNNISVKPGDDNYVTAYDVLVQKTLCERLKNDFPTAEFMGEEGEAHKLYGGLCFIIDPIDGTTNFIHGCDASAVSVALCEDKQVKYGVVYNPYKDELFYAEKTKGAFLNGKRIFTAQRPLKQALTCFGTAPYYKEKTEETFAVMKDIFLKSGDLRRCGSAALDLCNVACGRLDLFYEATLFPWDYAAASLIVAEAGGVVTQYNQSELDLAAPCSVLGGSKTTYDEYISSLNK